MNEKVIKLDFHFFSYNDEKSISWQKREREMLK